MVNLINALSIVLAALSLRASAAALDNGVSKPDTSSLENRGSLCCALAQNTQKIQTTCQYMYDNCGGWRRCTGPGNENNWCRYCMVTHPEADICTKATWPPVDPAPISKRSVDDAVMAPPEEGDGLENKHGELQKRNAQQVQTQYTANTARSYVKYFGLVTVHVAVSALNVLSYTIQNSGAAEIAFSIIDSTTHYVLGTGSVDSGEVTHGHSPSQVLAKGGDLITININ